ncbi:DNA internalization-related competence protein ComEC/Rec2 [bacterium]|nr:DNA internalization-related competence protein ComEC/Rec2 [bacterium]
MKHLPAVKTTLLLALGILAGPCRPMHFSSWICISVLLILLTSTLALWKIHFGRSWILALMICMTGWMRLNMAYWHPANHLSNLPVDKDLSFKAHLFRDPEYRPERTVYWLAADSVYTQRGWLPVCGRLRLTRYRESSGSLVYGDQIIATGHILPPASRRNPGGFDYRAYLLTRNVSGLFIPAKGTPLVLTGVNKGHILLRHCVYPARRWIMRTLEQFFTGDSEILLKALILGDRTDISEEMRESFAKIGIIHVLAVSGLHVGFVLLFLCTCFTLIRMPQSWRTVLTISGLLLYCLITESKPPVVRATIMACVYLAGQHLERQSNPFNTLSVAALILLLINPFMLFDAGFQLSFSAVFSILYFYPKWKTLPGFRQMDAWCIKRRGFKNLWLLFLVSLSAQIGTLPVVVLTFNRFPVFGVLANLFAVPLAALIVAYGFTVLLCAPVSVWIAEIYAGFTDILVRLLLCIAKMLQTVPYLNITLQTPNNYHIGLYLSALFLIFHWHHPVWRKRLIFISVIFLNLMVWHAALTSSASKITYVQLDVGQGDAAVIHLPRHRTLIIDGGDRHAGFDTGKRILIPYLNQKGIRKIEAVILTHSHNDHAGGLISLVNAFKIDQFIVSDTLASGKPMHELLETIHTKQIPIKLITALDSLIFPGAHFYFLSPDQTMSHHRNVNNRSVVALLLFGKHRFLFMGDAETPAENRLCQSFESLSADILKIGHHGSHTASSQTFLNRVQPKHAIISVGKNNRFGHPDPATLHVLSELEIEIHRTDHEGALMFRSDGKNLSHEMW